MKFKELLNRCLFYISVPKCVCCGVRLTVNEGPLCQTCLEKYKEIKLRNCSICSKTLDRCTCPNKYLDSHLVHNLIKVYRYVSQEDLPSNKLIFSLKKDNRIDVLGFLSSELADAISASVSDPENYVFTNVPRRRKEIVKFGIDHGSLLAKHLAKYYSAEYYQPIISKSKKPQKNTSGEERFKNVLFKVKRGAKSLEGKKVIIVDDVVTTGASMARCAMLLKSLGAKKIIGAAISVAYKDTYTPFDKSDRFCSK